MTVPSPGPKRNQDQENQDQEDRDARLAAQFTVPSQYGHDVPVPPKIKVDLPPHPDKPRPGTMQPGSYKGTALAMQAASSFIMPIILLGILGWFLDGRFHTGVLLVIVFFILGFIVGVANLMRVVNQMDDGSSKKSQRK